MAQVGSRTVECSELCAEHERGWADQSGRGRKVFFEQPADGAGTEGARQMSKFNVGNTKSSKLTGVEVMEIREKYATGVYTMNRLAQEYGVTRNTVSDVVHCITWQSLPGVP